MADGLVFVDTAAWISFFRPGESIVGDRVRRLIETDRVVLAGPVLAEFLQGARSEAEAQTLRLTLGVRNL